MGRNVKILYILSCLGNAWFWLATWVLYYLLFTDYAGIGLIEAFSWFALTLIEIPSGAIADIWGRKRVMILSYLLIGSGNIFMVFADGLGDLVVGGMLTAIGFAFLSGAFEAITYDSLKESNREQEYEKIYSRQKSITLLTYVIASFLGGLIYVHFGPGYPFAIAGICAFCAAFLVMFLVEPQIAHDPHTSWASVWKQNKSGFLQLFRNYKLKPFTHIFLLVGLVPVFMYEYLADVSLVDKGATPEQMGIFVSIVLLAAAASSFLTTYLTKYLGLVRCYFIIGAVYALLLILVPFVGLWTLVLFNIFWASSTIVRQVIESKVVNDFTPSQNRATTLSTLSMLRFLPYSTTIFFVGYFADNFSVNSVVFVLGIMMSVLTLVAFLKHRQL